MNDQLGESLNERQRTSSGGDGGQEGCQFKLSYLAVKC